MMRPGMSVCLEVGEGLADAGEGAAEVDVDDGVEVLVGHLQQALVPQDAGVGDQDVEPAERIDRCLDQLLRNLRAADGATTAAALPPSASMVRTASAATSASTSLMTTAAPWRASSRAYASPSPRPLPVTIATLPEGSLLLLC